MQVNSKISNEITGLFATFRSLINESLQYADIPNNTQLDLNYKEREVEDAIGISENLHVTRDETNDMNGTNSSEKPECNEENESLLYLNNFFLRLILVKRQYCCLMQVSNLRSSMNKLFL